MPNSDLQPQRLAGVCSAQVPSGKGWRGEAPLGTLFVGSPFCAFTSSLSLS